jgi:cobaltochelatase CobS
MANQSLLDALRINDFTERRKRLRELATTALSHVGNDTIRNTFSASPLVGDDSNQVTPRPTMSGLRDNLDEDTLIALINGDINATDVLDAIEHPDTQGVASSTAKCGYVFGRPQYTTSGLRERILTNNTETPMAHSFGLQDRIDIHDACANHHGHDSVDVLACMKAVMHEDKPIDALAQMLRARDDSPVPDIASLSQPVQDVIKQVCDELDGTSAPTTSPSTSVYDVPADTQLVDLALKQAGLPTIATLIGELNDATAQAVAASRAIIPQVTETSTSTDIPNGRVITRKAKDVFNIKGVAAQSFDFEVPVWEWDAPHPHVPEIDRDYQFQGTVLMRVLYALLTNKRTYLHGHSGTGKTTHVEQVAAHLFWPFMRVNFDSEITRMDLIGRDTLVQESGTTVSKFVDGILPQMMSGPYIGCFDELDFVRPDVAYVMQRMFEGNGLMLTEDGGRIVKPHGMFRMFATGNTVGQGDEFGMYQGARPQSMAMLDRFTVWAHVDYLNERERAKLIETRVPSLAKDMVAKINKYVTEHIEAFKTSKVMQPITPRGYIDLAASLTMFLQVFPSSKQSKAIEQAVEMTVLDRASVQDRAVLKGIVNRVFN